MFAHVQPGAAASAPPLATDRAGKVLRWFIPRPAEWVLLVFGLYLLVTPHAAPSDGSRPVPRTEFILGALELFTVRLLVTWFRTPWSNPGTRLARLYPVTVIFPLMPAAVGFFDSLSLTPEFFPIDPGNTVTTLTNLVTLVLHRTMVGSIPLLLWLAYGIHVKQRGTLALRSFVIEDGVIALDFIRDVAALIVIIAAYSSMSELLTHPFAPDRDPVMERIDTAVFFGVSPVHALQHAIRPWLTDWLTFCYVMYAVLVPLTWGGLLWSGKRRTLTEFAFAATATLAIGYMIYPFVPVRGPMHSETFTVPLDSAMLGAVRSALIDPFRVARDCFPSLHTAFTTVMGLTLMRHVRWLWWVLSPIVISMPFACVYLRYHYVTDVLAGLVLAALVTVATRKLYPTIETPKPA